MKQSKTSLWKKSMLRTLNWWDITKHLDEICENGCEFGYEQFDREESEYYSMMSSEEGWAVEEATKRIERLTKRELIRRFRKVLTLLLLFFDIKASHDCLISIVEELDERAAMKRGGKPPQRSWVE
jgi:hypothetical protein